MIKTKIIATLGPSCSGTEIVKAMIANGVDVFRLNFSHGTLAEHADHDAPERSHKQDQPVWLFTQDQDWCGEFRARSGKLTGTTKCPD